MHHEELYKYFPESIEGYKKERPIGSTKSHYKYIDGPLCSFATVSYKNNTGNKVKIYLYDNNPYSIYSDTMSRGNAIMSLVMSADTLIENIKSFKIKNNIDGWESFKKGNKKAIVFLYLGDRFFLYVEADNQKNTEFVKEIARKMNLETLAVL